jgi:PPM family protein phosphatase
MGRAHSLDVDDLLSIGEFSSRCGLSIKMLRSYAKAGLFSPAAVDAASGYRYYSTGQLHLASVIGLLRQAGIGIDEIRLSPSFPSPRLPSDRSLVVATPA